MTADVSKLLADPQPGMTLDQLASELNGLARIRDNARLAFCKRLAVVYMMIVGHRPVAASKDGAKFFEWCNLKLISATGKKYSPRTLGHYLKVGFAKNPQRALNQIVQTNNRAHRESWSIKSAVKHAVTTDNPPKVIPITKLKQQGMPTDVAREVNVLMTAWEQASSQARSQFIYIVTGKRVAA